MMYDVVVYNPFTITFQILFSNVPNVETANELLEMYVSDVIPKDVFSQIKFYKDYDKALTVDFGDFGAGCNFHINTHYIGRIVKKSDFF